MQCQKEGTLFITGKPHLGINVKSAVTVLDFLSEKDPISIFLNYSLATIKFLGGNVFSTATCHLNTIPSKCIELYGESFICKTPLFQLCLNVFIFCYKMSEFIHQMYSLCVTVIARHSAGKCSFQFD